MTNNESIAGVIDRIRRELANSNVEAAEAILKDGQNAFPHSLPLKLMEGEILEQKGDLTGAYEHYRRTSKDFPNNPSAEIRLVRLAIVREDFAEAEQCLAEAERRGLREPRLSQIHAQIADKKGDLIAARRAMEKAIASMPKPGADSLLRLAHVCFRLKDYGAMPSLVERALEINPHNVGAHHLMARSAMATGDSNKAEKAYWALLKLQPGNPRWASEAIVLLNQQGANDKAIAVLRRGMDSGLEGYELFKHVLSLPLPPDLEERVVSWAQTVEADAPDIQKAWAINLLLSYNRPLNDGLLHSIREDSPSKALSDMRGFYADAPPDSALLRPLVMDKASSEVTVARADKPDGIVLYFTGLGGHSRIPNVILDRYFAALNLTTVYLRDFSWLFFNAGIRSVAKDYEGTLAYLRNLLFDMGSTRLITMGWSSGGYAAMRYGLDLGAETIISLSGPTKLNASFEPRVRVLEKRSQRELPAEAMDIVPLLRAGGGRSSVHLAYGESMRVDRMHAHYIKDEPGVTLHPLQDMRTHSSLTELIRQKKLMPFLQAVIFPAKAGSPEE